MKVNENLTILYEEIFAGRLMRLKESLGVKTDSELARELGVTQQAIAGVKNRYKIPASWIVKMIERGISFDWVFYGREILKEDATKPNQEPCQEESDQRIAKSLVIATLKDFSMTISSDQIPPMETYVKKFILPEVKGKIADFINDFSTHGKGKE